MIKKSIAVTIFLLIAWGCFIELNPFSISQNQWEGNIIRSEKIMFDTERLDNLIVGSSLSRRLHMSRLPNFYNLSFDGQSLFDGLNILENSKILPKNVFIEFNVVERDEDANFRAIISSPILNPLKKNFKVFRTDKKPLAYLGNGFTHVVDDFFEKFIYKIRDAFKHEAHANGASNTARSGNLVFDKMLALQIGLYSAAIDTSIMNKRFDKLKHQVGLLESNGVKVIFFEMPVNPQLVELNKAVYLRNRVKDVFPENVYIKLPENISEYKTKDGVHLTIEEADRYSKYFKNEIENVAGVAYK